MKRSFKRRLRWLGLVVLLFGVGLLLYCWDHRIWSYEQWWVYQEMDKECDPVWREYHYRRIRAGDSVEEVIAQTKPRKVRRQGKWTILAYGRNPISSEGIEFTTLTAYAYEGQMIFAYAGSCCWLRIFLDELTEEQCQELFKAPKSKVFDHRGTVWR